MITAELDYRGQYTCPVCTAKFDISPDEDSYYDGASTEFECPYCGRRLKAEAYMTYEISYVRD